LKRSARSRPATEIGSNAVANSPAKFAAMLPKETDQWAKALRAIGLAK
jgi:F420-0:gamma-glutamyl ligase-like protein